MKNLTRPKNFISTLILLAFLLFCSNFVSAESQKILISEFMAINDKTIADEDGDNCDWIELYNPGEETINLKGWFITDKKSKPTKWEFPDVSINAGTYMLVFASDKERNDPTSELHTNFKLSGSGEYLAIIEPDGTVSHSYGDSYPAQREDVSYGIYEGEYVYFSEPTPGTANTIGNTVLAPTFSKTRGFYDDAFDVTLSTVGNGMKIYYTTDGTRPSATTGALYSNPINISGTTPLSAITVNESGDVSEIITHTYLFINDIVKQSNTPEGYPDYWSKNKFSSSYQTADYEMDSTICNSDEYKNLMDDALTSIPTISIVTDVDNLFSHEEDENKGGIYIFTANSGYGSLGKDWERPTSVEYYDPSTEKQFQVNCGIRLHGGNSRVPENSPKHSFRISFRSKYGPSKLNFRFFDDEDATNEFNALVIRAGYNYSWVKNNATQREKTQYLQDPFAKNTQLALGQISAHQKFVHLYLNGLYWGLYNVSEKLTNDFMESYYDGDEDDFDVVKDHSGVVDGETTTWDNLCSQAKNGLASNASYQKAQGKDVDGKINTSYDNLLDVENLIGYMQYNMYIGNEDWDQNNWIAGRNRVTNETGFHFFCWDAETSMTDVNYSNVDENNEGNPSGLYYSSQNNEDFKMLFADNIQKNFLNGGPLSPEECAKRYTKLADEIDLAIIAESARWGDYRKYVAPSDDEKVVYTRNDYWLPQKEELLNNYFPYRTAIVVEQFRAIGLFPEIKAPVLSEESGEKESAINLEMTTNDGDIYYTTDGNDPREQITSNVSSSAKTFTEDVYLSSDVTVNARAKSGNDWSPITTGVFNFKNGSAIDNQNEQDFNYNCYPNPFLASTQIKINLPKESDIQISIYTIDGRLVDNIFNGKLLAGKNLIKWTPRDNERGIFICKIEYRDNNYFCKIIRK